LRTELSESHVLEVGGMGTNWSEFCFFYSLVLVGVMGTLVGVMRKSLKIVGWSNGTIPNCFQ
jgi:hypothetical protein